MVHVLKPSLMASEETLGMYRTDGGDLVRVTHFTGRRLGENCLDGVCERDICRGCGTYFSANQLRVYENGQVAGEIALTAADEQFDDTIKNAVHQLSADRSDASEAAVALQDLLGHEREIPLVGGCLVDGDPYVPGLHEDDAFDRAERYTALRTH